MGKKKSYEVHQVRRKIKTVLNDFNASSVLQNDDN